MKITFHGAAGEVTGSCYEVDTGRTRFLVDCGLFQGGRTARTQNFAALHFDVRQLDFVIVTHAHIDHSGLLPRLAALGFRGPIHATPATCDLLKIMLPDSGHLQEAEVEWENRRRHRSRIEGGRRGCTDCAPLYTVRQAHEVLAQLRPLPYGERAQLADDVALEFYDAGHILGSASARVVIGRAEQARTIVFSGDLGQPGRPLMNDPAPLPAVDVLLVESTYGDRDHRLGSATEDELVEVLNQTLPRGNVVIPAFAVGRTQEILYWLVELIRQQRVPRLNIFVDSPMATAATHLTEVYANSLDDDAKRAFAWWHRHRHLAEIRFTADVEESKRLNQIQAGAVIISASGMCDAGRIKHHLRWNLPRPQSAVVIAGYQAEGTLGRRLVEGAKTVKLLGDTVPVRAAVHTLGGLSAHADRSALLGWLRRAPRPPAQTFVVHGEPGPAQALADAVRGELGWPKVVVPQAGQSFTLD